MFIEMTLTREDKVWESIQEINNGNGPADGDILNKNTTSWFNTQNVSDTSYKSLLALFVGSYYVNTLDVMPRVTDEDLIQTRDNLGEYYYQLWHEL